jgi:hypothetical protein
LGALLAGREPPTDVTTDLAAPLLGVVDDLLPEVLHDTAQYANNRIECDHGRLKARLRPMRGLRTDRTASTVIRGHAFVQNLRRGHYELGVDARHERLRVAAAFDKLAASICPKNEATTVRRGPRSLDAIVPYEISLVEAPLRATKVRERDSRLSISVAAASDGEARDSEPVWAILSRPASNDEGRDLPRRIQAIFEGKRLMLGFVRPAVSQRVSPVEPCLSSTKA